MGRMCTKLKPQNPMNIIESRISRVAVGMSQDEVQQLLGPPTHARDIVANGCAEGVWEYSLCALARNIPVTDGQKFALGLWSAVAGINGRAVLLKITFANGSVTRIM